MPTLRLMNQPFVSSIAALPEPTEPALWFIFNDMQLLVQSEGPLFTLPAAADLNALGWSPQRQQYIGRLGETHCLCADAPPDAPLPAGWRFLGLRRLFDHMAPDLFHIAVRAVQLVAWNRNTQFCGRCGQPTQPKPTERAKLCPRCNLTTYPRISPAIIVAVTRDNTLLLARAHRHPPGFYSVLAGFVEPGETLEETVRREVQEEVGIEVDNIHYFGSQPWPFPDSLMLAFTATYASGEITLEESEIADAGWYTAANLPLIPPPISIARALIDAFVSAQSPPSPLGL